MLILQEIYYGVLKCLARFILKVSAIFADETLGFSLTNMESPRSEITDGIQVDAANRALTYPNLLPTNVRARQ